MRKRAALLVLLAAVFVLAAAVPAMAVTKRLTDISPYRTLVSRAKGTTVVVSGKLTYQVGPEGSWRPLANRTVYFYRADPDGRWSPTLASRRTDSLGRFSYTATVPRYPWYIRSGSVLYFYAKFAGDTSFIKSQSYVRVTLK